MNATAVTTSPYPPAAMDEITARLHRDGFARVDNLVSPEECAALREGIDRALDDDRYSANRYGGGIAVRLFEVDPIFEDLLTREPIITLVEHLLDPTCHLIAQNAIRSGARPSLGWHIDDPVFYPLPPGRTSHPPDAVLPPHALVVQIPLTDVSTVEDGPTEYVAGSHYSGRAPDDPALTPDYDGRAPVPMLAAAGDVYLHNGQCWHTGAANTSGRQRYLLQLAFGRRYIAQRFHPYVNYRLPVGVLERADARRRRVLGLHEPAAYG